MKNKITIILGSKSDIEKLKDGFAVLDELGILYECHVVSAHRNPDKLRRLCQKMKRDGTKVVIAAAGLAAALPGFVASYMDIPVIGVPLTGGEFDGLDSLLSIVQSPRGLGLVSSGFDKRGFINAVIFSLEILALRNKNYHKKLIKLKNKFRK
ncbi:MAG: hypothetical protein B1H08_01325 [Candidatus Omnitrophica bacterium 4484_171]|nr:MAG: hypothetical protein B1H08_01325 [Candidatus Omnitrophica bacterium 4484_171]